jgi:hypothetical protein
MLRLQGSAKATADDVNIRMAGLNVITVSTQTGSCMSHTWPAILSCILPQPRLLAALLVAWGHTPAWCGSCAFSWSATHFARTRSLKRYWLVAFFMLKNILRIYTCLLVRIAGYAGAYPAYPAAPPLATLMARSKKMAVSSKSDKSNTSFQL